MRIFIGYDPREAVAFHTCVQSIIDHAKDPTRLQITPVRGARRDGSNDFIYARFLVPYLCGYSGNALFLDGDMIVRADVSELLDMPPVGWAVAVVRHPDYETKYPTKYLGNVNSNYPRKNWSSVTLWNCGYAKHRVLTPEFVARADGSYLHRFLWLRDGEIKGLDEGWNRLVLEQAIKPTDKLLHYTIGTPCFPEYADCDGANEWWATYRRATAPVES